MLKLNEYLSESAETRWQEFSSTLSKSNKTVDYFVNWSKVCSGVEKHEIALNGINYLVSKKDIYNEALKLFTNYPQWLTAVPLLLAIRDSEFKLIDVDVDGSISYDSYNFHERDRDIVDYVDFMEGSGLLDFLRDHANKSLVDYAYGVEVGLDSNARKNRSGDSMESILEDHLKRVSDFTGFDFIPQATQNKIRETWNFEVPVDKSSRIFDGALFNHKSEILFLFETNFYNGGGSKLKSVAGEFIELNNLLKPNNNICFSWVTDGQGWLKAKNPMLEAMGNMVNIFNIHMMSKNFIKELVDN